ncbi:hypothetical protein Taro_005421 [Colocasia esculenta]|uniref:CCHC-type domain-containing protein n=1 Tax=Colocasia esculenta TaxID=4460 RepID=A0A843TXT7_COLES|nr:hypothetical protein [Colocasia esculenta]
MAAQGYAEGQSVNRPSLFDGEDYNYWKTRMEFFLQGLDFQLWSIIEEGDLVVLNSRENWIDEDKRKISLNSKAKSILCCTLSKKEFNRISVCKSAMEMWEKLRITYEGTDKLRETRIDILVAQYERFQMKPGESITQMCSRFTDITNGLAGLGKGYDMGDMVRKILRSLSASWTPKVTTIEEANDIRGMPLEKLVGSLMAHEINMERLGESSSRKKHNNALKAVEDTSGNESDDNKSNGSSEDEEAFLSRRLQRILAKKKYFKKGKDFKKSEVKDTKISEPVCYECKKPGHIKAECPKLKKTEFKKKDHSKKFRKYKKKAMAVAWSNDSDSDSESSSSEEEEEKANLAFMANIDEKVETDSLNLLHIVTGQLLRPWDFAFILQEIAVIANKVEAAITYVPRESNKVADCLAEFAFPMHISPLGTLRPIYQHVWGAGGEEKAGEKRGLLPPRPVANQEPARSSLHSKTL